LYVLRVCEEQRVIDPLHAAYHAAIDADRAWSAELTRLYGRNAGDARYDARGTATPELARLWAVTRAANEARYRLAAGTWSNSTA
jgi:hypothetical protein